MTRRSNILLTGCLAFLALGLLLFDMSERRPHKEYYRHNGHIFGTTYTIQYQATTDLEDTILARLRQVDSTLSMFNPQSAISRFNRGENIPVTSMLDTVLRCAQSVSERSEGAFDVTIAPLVNYWGFGTQTDTLPTRDMAVVDSILQFVNYQMLDIHEGHLYRFDPRVEIDLSAIAKGYACDEAAAVLRDAGCEHYLVDIGGEVVAHGLNRWGNPWSVGIVRPIDDELGLINELQDTLHTTDICMATSGNYRRFYYESGLKRSHTIDPRTGQPVQHSLLSATVVAGSCMEADALATACMVLGEQQAVEFIEQQGAQCYLIVSTEEGTDIITSPSWHLTQNK